MTKSGPLKNPTTTAFLGFLVGLVIGLVVLGWGVWPVTWTDADPSFLRADLQDDYLRMAVDSYRVDANDALAVQRFQTLGVNGPAALSRITANYPDQNIIRNFSDVVMRGAAVMTPAAGGGGNTGNTNPLTSYAIIGGAILVLILVGYAILRYMVPLFRRMTPSTPNAASRAREITGQTEMTDYAAMGEEPPIAQFVTTYVLGDDLFDDSFSIDSPSGEFLGECGIGISETIGVGEPKKVQAFEVWLFDKNDIQTVTKVLMSTHAFNDIATYQKLEAKGEPFMVEDGKQVVLETAALQLVATVSEMQYGQGALPDGSFFDRMTLEIAVWPKVAPPQ